MGVQGKDLSHSSMPQFPWFLNKTASKGDKRMTPNRSAEHEPGTVERCGSFSALQAFWQALRTKAVRRSDLTFQSWWLISGLLKVEGRHIGNR